MSRIERDWIGRDYDGIRISTARCNIHIEGTSDNRIKFESDLDTRITGDSGINSGGRWLTFDFVGRRNVSRLNLKLPEDKLWTLHISESKGEIKIDKIQGSCKVLLGHGTLHLENCAGNLAVVSGRADIEIKSFNEIDIPAAPAFPKVFGHSEIIGEENDLLAGEDYWENWGEDLGSRIKAWVLDSRQLFNSAFDAAKGSGLNLKVVRGNINLDNCRFSSCQVIGRKCDLKIEKGQTGYLETVITKGNIEVDSALSGADWNLKNHMGNISLKLDSRTAARMDIATRFGDIHSEIPLVRVARQGPFSCYSKRMVGLMGQDSEDKAAVLRLATVHGNIEIKAQSASSNYTNPPDLKYADSPQIQVLNHSAVSEDSYKTTLEVLQALSEKRISVEEAERLLRNLPLEVNN